MSIAILCPSRQRPDQFKRMVESVKNKAIVYLAITEQERDLYKELTPTCPTLILSDGMPTAYKWEILCSYAFAYIKDKHKLFMLGSDDMYFQTEGWDRALIDHYNSLEDKRHVYALQDSRDANGTPHPIMTREYIDHMGYFVPPIFLHWYVDGWTVEIAKNANKFTHMKDYLLMHDKPSDRGAGDETHNRIREWGWRNRDEYVNSMMRSFLESEKKRFAE